MLTGNIKAVRNMWFIGDSFLQDIFATFSSIRREAIITNRSQPFAYAYFNPTAFYQGSNVNGIKNILARILNSFIEALNRNESLPSYIMVILDKDIIKNINHFNYGISWIISRCLHWLCTQINRLIITRRNEIIDQRPGALLTNNQPIVIWIKMLDRPKMTYKNRNLEKILALHSKFNDLMSSAVEQAGHHTLMIDECLEFDFSGNLTTPAKVRFWRNFDEKFKELHYSFNTSASNKMYKNVKNLAN